MELNRAKINFDNCIDGKKTNWKEFTDIPLKILMHWKNNIQNCTKTENYSNKYFALTLIAPLTITIALSQLSALSIKSN
jgi:hypothetical protein